MNITVSAIRVIPHQELKEKVAFDTRIFNCFNEPECCYVFAEDFRSVEVAIF
jgi:hypothetical protein